MSKSQGNVIAPEEVVKKVGAEILRLWVSMVDYRDDVRFSWDVINAELGGLPQDPQHPAVPPGQPLRLHARGRRALRASSPSWTATPSMLLDRVVARITKAYEEFAFHLVYHELIGFCTVDALGLLPRHPEGPPLLQRRGRTRAPRRSDRALPPRRRPRPPHGAHPALHGGGGLGPAPRPRGLLGPHGHLPQGLGPGRRGSRGALGEAPAGPRRGEQGPRGVPQGRRDRQVPRGVGAHRPRRRRAGRASRDATKPSSPSSSSCRAWRCSPSATSGCRSLGPRARSARGAGP